MVKLITLELAYATPQKQTILAIQVKENTTIEEAIKQSGILETYPEIDLTKQKVGVFSKLKKLTDIPQQNDRIEIYRLLILDPKEARRQRVKLRSRSR